MPKKERHDELGHRRIRAENQYFIGLFEWGSTPRETEIAAEEHMFFRGEMDLTEAHDHKDDRWQLFKQRALLAEEGKENKRNGGHSQEGINPVEEFEEK